MRLLQFALLFASISMLRCESFLQAHSNDDSSSKGCPLAATFTTKLLIGSLDFTTFATAAKNDLCAATEFLLHTKGNAPVSDSLNQNRWWCSESYVHSEECEAHPPTPPNAYLLMPPAAHLKPRMLWIRQHGWLSGDPRIEYKIDDLPNASVDNGIRNDFEGDWKVLRYLSGDSINHEMDGLIYDPKEMTLRLFIRKPHLGYTLVRMDDQQYIFGELYSLSPDAFEENSSKAGFTFSKDVPVSNQFAFAYWTDDPINHMVYFQDNIQREGSNGKAIYAVPLEHIDAFLDDEASPAEFTSKLITTVYQDNPFGLVEVTGGTLHFDWNKPPRFLALDALELDRVCLKYFIEMTDSCFAIDVKN